MRKMRNRTYLIISLVISSILLPSFPAFYSNKVNISNLNFLKTSALTEINTTIIIDDFPGSSTNWTWAKDQGYCTGSGTLGDPYIIADLFFNTSTIFDNCLSIRNSLKYFIIRDCKFKGSYSYGGIQLFNTSFGSITNNMMYPSTGALVWLLNASYNVVYDNNASAGYYYGILIEGSSGYAKMNHVYDNLVINNYQVGIQLMSAGCILNRIEGNTVYNSDVGIQIGSSTKNNTIVGNRIGNNTIRGISVLSASESNNIYSNCFFNNTLHALDDGINNKWDDGSKGNYWDNYTGLDANNDGIGDIPYNITGIAGSQDNYPLMNCPAPSIPQGIPGYELYTFVLTCVFTMIGVVLFTRKKKQQKFN